MDSPTTLTFLAQELRDGAGPGPALTLTDLRVLGVVFGIAGPALCFYVNETMAGGPPPLIAVLGGLPVYSLVATEIVWMIVWLVRPPTRPLIGALSMGAFLVATCFAATVGLVLFPFSMLALIWVIGLLGLIPFGTAYTFGRLSGAASRVARLEDSPRRGLAVALGAVLACAPAVVVETSAEHAMQVAIERLRADDPAAIESARAALDAVPWFDDVRIVDHWRNESDENQHLRLGELYSRRTGKDIAHALPLLMD
ncbi:MAG TPA: hypothetical protein VK843_13415 [Planctomycetota bacterium]|nr:hypothetical protein [Planctomycetota bacterium]